MSIIISIACPMLVMQMGDRLVSKRTAKFDPLTRKPFTQEPFDPLSNKTLVYRAKNAIVSIGYAGIAYLEGRPTDVWIAEKLWGEPLPIHDGRTPMAMGRRPLWLDIGSAVCRLQLSIESLPPSLHALFVTIAGWQAVGRSARPIVIELERKPGAHQIERIHSPRWWPRGQDLRIHEIGGYLSREDCRLLAQRFKNVLRTGDRPDDTLDSLETVLAETLREISKTNSGVGANLLSVVIPFFKLRRPRVRFLPEDEHQIVFSSPTITEVMTVHYTPWLIGPSILYPASAEVGSSVINLGGIEIEIGGAEAKGPIKCLSSSHKRPPPPTA